METKFNFKSAVCTSRSQSERLLALGLRPETADMHWWDNEYGCCTVISRPAEKDDYGYGEVIPAWSLHRLLLLLPKEIRIERNFYTIAVVNDSIQIVDDCGDIYRYFMSMNVYGELIDCIAWLIKEGYFNKEYLEE